MKWFIKKFKKDSRIFNSKSSLLTLIFCGLNTLIALPANADIISMCLTPQTCTAAGAATTGVNGTVGLTWSGLVENLSQSPSTSELVASNGGFFYVPGGPTQITVLGTINTPISQSVNYTPASGPAAFTISESITVPASVSAAAANLGNTSVRFRRDFQSPFSTVSADIQITLLPAPPGTPGTPVTPPTTGGNNPQGFLSSNLDLQSVVLRFDDDSISRIVQRDEKLRAEVELTYANGGMLVGQWEVATPASTQGEPVFLPVENVRLYLNPSRNKLLISPELPSDQIGLYLLRFRILQPQQVNNTDTIQVQYFVREQMAAMQKNVRDIRVLAPNKNAWLAPTTQFRWQAIPGARAYRVEIFTSDAPPATWAERYANARRSQSSTIVDEQRAVTGVLVPGTQTEANISPVSFGYLNKRNEYLWRVIAIDNNGFVIGETAPRSIFTR